MINKFISIIILIISALFVHSESITEFLNKAKLSSSQGKYGDALNAYNKAIELDSNNYVIYIKRAFVLLNLNKNNEAIDDFTKVINLKPDFYQAYVHRAKTYLKNCDLEEAESDLKHVLSKTNNDEYIELLDNIKNAKDALKVLKKNKNNDNLINQLNVILNVCPRNLQLRLERADYYMKIGEKEQAMGDLLKATKLQPDNTEVLLKLSKLHLSIGEVDESLKDVKECLHRDPENKPCKTIFKQLKKITRKKNLIEEDQRNGNWKSVVEKVDGETGFLKEADSLGALNLRQYARNILCQAYIKEKKPESAMKWCNMAIELDERNINNYLNRGEAFMLKEEYEKAIHDFNKAREINPQNPQIMEKLQRAQKLMKLAKQKDYYKILNVPKTATKREIKKAYRKLAQQYHPDKYEGDMTKEQVQDKMSEINQAYEVLSDDELRERYDNGDDPNDPTGGQQGNPFQGFQGFQGFQFPNGFPFGNGNGNFQFHFKFQ